MVVAEKVVRIERERRANCSREEVINGMRCLVEIAAHINIDPAIGRIARSVRDLVFERGKAGVATLWCKRVTAVAVVDDRPTPIGRYASDT